MQGRGGGEVKAERGITRVERPVRTGRLKLLLRLGPADGKKKKKKKKKGKPGGSATNDKGRRERIGANRNRAANRPRKGGTPRGKRHFS